MVLSFWELSKHSATNEEFICIVLSAKRSLRLQKETSCKNIIYRYLEENWTYSYINNLDQFVKTINSRVNRVTKLAPNKVSKKDIPRLVSLTVETRRSQKPKLYVGDFVRIVKKEKNFPKRIQAIFH